MVKGSPKPSTIMRKTAKISDSFFALPIFHYRSKQCYPTMQRRQKISIISRRVSQRKAKYLKHKHMMQKKSGELQNVQSSNRSYDVHVNMTHILASCDVVLLFFRVTAEIFRLFFCRSTAKHTFRDPNQYMQIQQKIFIIYFWSALEKLYSFNIPTISVKFLPLFSVDKICAMFKSFRLTFPSISLS